MPNVLDDTGIQIASLDEIQDAIKAPLLIKYPNLNLTAEAFDGQLIESTARQVRQVLELVQGVAAGRDPGQALGFQMRALAATTGTTVRPAAATYVPCTVNVDPGTYLPGDLVAALSADPTKRFENVTTVENLGVSPDDFDVNFICQQTGPIVVGVSALTVIAESFPGWNSVENTQPSTGPLARFGYLAESTADLRLRQQEELAAAGSTTAAAVRAKILDLVPGIIDCFVLENDSDVVDANGQSAKSLWPIVRGGTDADIARVAFFAKAGGIRLDGDTTVVVTDSQGRSHESRFSRSVAVPIYSSFGITVIESEYAGEAALEEAFLSAIGPGGGGRSGRDVTLSDFTRKVLNVPGVYKIDYLKFDKIGMGTPTTDTDVVINPAEYPTIDWGDVTYSLTTITEEP